MVGLNQRFCVFPDKKLLGNGGSLVALAPVNSPFSVHGTSSNVSASTRYGLTTHLDDYPFPELCFLRPLFPSPCSFRLAPRFAGFLLVTTHSSVFVYHRSMPSVVDPFCFWCLVDFSVVWTNSIHWIMARVAKQRAHSQNDLSHALPSFFESYAPGEHEPEHETNDGWPGRCSQR